MSLNIKKLSDSELKDLACLFDKEGRGEMLVRSELKRREILALQEDYGSEKIPYLSSLLHHRDRVAQLSMDFDLMETLPCLWQFTCDDWFNNLSGELENMFNRNEVSSRYRTNLAFLKLLFNDPEYRVGYEAVYNNLNFIENAIYRRIAVSRLLFTDVDLLMKTQPEKEEVVEDRLEDVVRYLSGIMDAVPGAACSVNDGRLNEVCSGQKALIEAVAFGCTMEELQKGDYQGAKKLIYVPREAMRK